MSETEFWYVALLVLEAVVHGPSGDPPIFDHQVRILRAADTEQAYQRALFIGRAEEHSYQNGASQEVSWKFRGLHDLAALEDQPFSDGAELLSFRLSAGRAFDVVPKAQLTCFWLASQTEETTSRPEK